MIALVETLIFLLVRLILPTAISSEIAGNVVSNPFQSWDTFLVFASMFVLSWLGWEVCKWMVYYGLEVRRTKKLVYLKVLLPRNDSKIDKEQQTKKDFREKVGIMHQLFRSLWEIKQLNLSNAIKSYLLKYDKLSFELVLEDQELNFYVITPPYFQSIVEKQITSYYPDADVTPVKDYRTYEKGFNLKGYYLYQKRPGFYPIKTYKTLEEDPLNGIANVFSKLEKQERAVFQVVLRPRGNHWRQKAKKITEDIFKGKKTGKFKGIPGLGWLGAIFEAFIGGNAEALNSTAPGADRGDAYIRMLQPQEEAIKRTGEKIGEPGFDSTLRILAFSKTSKQRVEDILNSIVVAFNLFQDNYNNWFQNRRIFFLDFINTPLLYFSFRKRLLGFFQKKCLLTPDELASLYHFPDANFNKVPVIKWMQYKVVAAPLEVPKDGIMLGYNVYRGVKTPIHMLKKDRTRHHYVIGKSGTGKSVFLAYMARQDVQSGEGLCVIDPHGDLVEDILMYVPKERAKEIVVFDPADSERPMALNILEAHTADEMDRASLDATEIFIKLYGDEIFGPRIQHYFRNGCLSLMEDQEDGATLIDVPRLFVDDAFLKYKLTKIKNPVVRSFWEHEYVQTGDREKQEMIPYFSAKFGPFITNTTMRNIIGQAKSAFNIREVMDSGKVLLVNLSKGKIGGLNAQLLGLILVNKVNMAAMSRADIPEEQRRDFFLYVDEFQNFATDTFATILSEARKYHLSLIMAHQYIGQLVSKSAGSSQQSTQIRDAVFGNVGTMMSFKVGAEDAEYLAKEYAPVLSEQDIIQVANYKAYIKLNINNTTSRVFSMETVYDTTNQNQKIAEIVKKYSRLKYGRKREFVDQEIEARLGISLAPAAPTSTEGVTSDTASITPLPVEGVADQTDSALVGQSVSTKDLAGGDVNAGLPSSSKSS